MAKKQYLRVCKYMNDMFACKVFYAAVFQSQIRFMKYAIVTFSSRLFFDWASHLAVFKARIFRLNRHLSFSNRLQLNSFFRGNFGFLKQAWRCIALTWKSGTGKFSGSFLQLPYWLLSYGNFAAVTAHVVARGCERWREPAKLKIHLSGSWLQRSRYMTYWVHNGPFQGHH